jgi:hypothetical protein
MMRVMRRCQHPQEVWAAGIKAANIAAAIRSIERQHVLKSQLLWHSGSAALTAMPAMAPGNSGVDALLSASSGDLGCRQQSCKQYTR